MNFYSKMHTNLVKWWDVNITDPAKIPVDGEVYEDDESRVDKALNAADDYDADAVADKLLEDALSGDYDTGAAADTTGSTGEEFVSSGDPEVDATAMEIYNRLMSEAAADEAAKIAEIEAAKLKAAEEN